MTLKELVDRLDLKIHAGGKDMARTIGGGYASDLLSDVIAHGRKNDLWITLQVHPNIVAVAVLKELAAVLLVNGRKPPAETIELAEKERVPILGSPLSAFVCAGKLYGLGIKGR